MKKRGGMKRNIFSKNYRGQVWVETVVYLLIAFIMIGLVLSFVKPKIEEMRDRSVIEQSLDIIKNIDNSMTTIGSTGNKRMFEVGIRKGSLIIDSERDRIIFEIESGYEYTEPGKKVLNGNIEALTETNGRNSKVTLTRDFSEGYDITYGGEQTIKTMNKAPNPYRLSLTNRGTLSNKVNINFNLE